MTYDDYIEACGLDADDHHEPEFGAREAWLLECESRESRMEEPRSFYEFLAGIDRPELPLPPQKVSEDDIPF